MPKSKMTEVRQDSSQPNESCRWIKNFVGVILAAVLLFVLFKELHSLSKDMDESRKLLKELSNRLAKTEKENENLRKELGRTKAKMENILQVFSNMQKVSRARRDHKPGHGSRQKCSKLRHCMERFNKGVNCTMIKKCMASRRKAFFLVYILNPFEEKKGDQGKAQLSWKKYINNLSNGTTVVISTGGVYYVYCRLRVGKRIRKVIIWKNNSVLFSSWPTFAANNSYGVVHMFGLAAIPSGTKLHVQVQFNAYTSLDGSLKQMSALFPDYYLDVSEDYDASSSRVPDRNINSFGAFLVS